MKTIRDYTSNDTHIIWFEDHLLADNNKTSLDELTTEEIKAAIESEKDAIGQESIWTGFDDYDAEGNIRDIESYIVVLTKILEDKEKE